VSARKIIKISQNFTKLLRRYNSAFILFFSVYNCLSFEGRSTTRACAFSYGRMTLTLTLTLILWPWYSTLT